VHGIDIAPEAVNEAAKRYPDFDVRCGDVRALPYADSSFDLVVSNSTLDHFRAPEDIDRALRELHRVLKSSGELIISMDNLQNPIIAIRSLLPFQLLKKLHLVPYFVGLTFGRRGLVAALNRAGFSAIETKAILHCPRFLAVPLAGFLQQRAGSGTRQKFLAFLAGFEVLERMPTSFFTGHYVAARAVKA
jgi:ubiquinone/menaquinone biosynthesis C-methylase UbiE